MPWKPALTLIAALPMFPRKSATIIDTCKRWEAAGADQLVFMIQAREHLPQADILESLRLFGREVMPHFSQQRRPRAVNG